jgi:hypothetical protein
MTESQSTLIRAAEAADKSRGELAELVYQPAAWSALSKAGKLAALLDLSQALKIAAEMARQIASAIGEPPPLVRAVGQTEDDSDG